MAVAATTDDGIRLSRRILQRYLLDDERPVVATRQHWAYLFEPVATALVSLVAVAAVSPAVEETVGELVAVLWWVWFAVLGRAVWRFAEWRNEWFVATDKRLIMTYGLLTHKVAMMPLRKVTDMNYGRSLLGRMLGYGTFVLESAGQEQAMREINWLPDPDDKYRRICSTIFGTAGWDPDEDAGPGPDEDREDQGYDVARAGAWDEPAVQDPFETDLSDDPGMADRFDADVIVARRGTPAGRVRRQDRREEAADARDREGGSRWEAVDRGELPADWDWVDEPRTRRRVAVDPDPTPSRSPEGQEPRDRRGQRAGRDRRDRRP
ncbi:PH domain-containing protein [Ornithinimicrobium sp. W1665]|uniref:PH domain-containing protein n=1 Tax=Ornithinimicrobium sp. W1665 TaxID=3416666 RepID=UPI003CEC18A9